MTVTIYLYTMQLAFGRRFANKFCEGMAELMKNIDESFCDEMAQSLNEDSKRELSTPSQEKT